MGDIVPMLAYDRDPLKETGSYVLVRRQSAQTFTSGTADLIDFLSGAAVEGNTDGIWNPTASTTALTVVVPGVYVISVNVAWEADVDGRRDLRLLLNGTIFAQERNIAQTGGLGNIHELSAVKQLAKGDAVTVQALQTAGNNLDVQSVDPYSPTLAMVRV